VKHTASRAISIALRSVTAGLLIAGVGCASVPSVKPSPYQVGVERAAPPSLSTASSQPSLVTGNDNAPPSMAPPQPAIVGMPSTRVNVSATNEPLGDVVARTARQAGLTAIIDPGVRGTVTRHLQSVSLPDAMTSLLGNQFQYQVRDGALVVTPIRLVQRTYTVDYLTMSRISSSSTLVYRGTNGGTGGAPTSGADAIQSNSQVDVWGELTQQLESIVFGNADTNPQNRASSNPGARPYQRCDQASGVCLRISPLASLVDVTASAEKQDEVARYVGLFSSAVNRQVLIRAQVVEVGLDRNQNYGVDWQAVLNSAKLALSATAKTSAAFATDPASTVTGNSASFNLGIGDVTLTAVLNALEKVGNVEVVAKPWTNALNQQKASFAVTRQEQFYTIARTPIVSPATGAITGYSEVPVLQTATVGLVFDVLPQISDKNVVMMAIRPSVTSISGRTDILNNDGKVQGTLPVTEHRESDTMARVRSGETIMIGGLIQKQTSTVRAGIPVLMNIPIIGRAFSSTRIVEKSSELVIFLTPEIISGQPPGGL
jgi:MSHA biogenesis protein MshL